MEAQVVTIRRPQDVIDLVNSGGVIAGASTAIILIALGGTFIDAYDFTSLSLGVVQLRHQFNLSASGTGVLSASMAFGALFGALIGGYYTDKIGRLRMFLLDLIFFVVAAIGAAVSVNLAMLIVFRVLMGLGVGLDFPVALSFIAEYSASRSKGKYVNMWQGMWYLAASLGFVVLLPFYYAGAGNNLWRWAVGLGALPAAIILTLRFKYMNESPMWVALQGNLHEAARVLRRTYGVEVAVEPDPRAEQRSLASTYSVRAFGRLFSPSYRSRTILAGVVGATQSMEYYAVGFYLPTISLLIFGKQFIHAITGSIVFNCCGIAGGFLQAFITQRIGCRHLAIAGYTAAVICLLLVGGLYGVASIYLAAVFVGAFIFAHSFGQGSQGMTIGTLSYPTSLRGAGSGFTQAVLRVGSIFGFFFFPILKSVSGLGTTLTVLAAVPFIGLVTCLAIRWEPVGQQVDADDFGVLPAGAENVRRAPGASSAL